MFLWRPMLFVLLITLAMEPEDLPQQSILIILRTNKSMISQTLLHPPSFSMLSMHFMLLGYSFEARPRGGGVLWISSGRDDQMGAKIKAQKNPLTKI